MARLARLGLLIALAVLSGCGPAASNSSTPSASGTLPTPSVPGTPPTPSTSVGAGSATSGGGTPSSAAPARSGSALALARTLTVKGRGPKTGYRRAQFGGWAEHPGGCTTRDIVLRRDLTSVMLRPGSCVVISGTLTDPYTGRTVAFSKANADAVQIDHVVALSDAWQKGAAGWTAPRRRQLANDPLELLAVDGPSNEAKGDGDTATWLPPNTSYRCAYVARQVAVKAKYGLSATAAEQNAMIRVLSTCPTVPPPSGSSSA